MESIEEETRPILIPMLRDAPTTLEPVAQDTLARWATLRILIAQHGHPPGRRRAIPPGRFTAFYNSRALPLGAQIWIGRCNGEGPWPTNYHHVELHSSAFGRPEPATPNGYFTAFSVGYLAFVYWGHEIESGPVVGNLGGLTPYLTPIWPARADPIVWPPRGLLGADGLQAVAKHFPIS
jgi:hypothetical protein